MKHVQVFLNKHGYGLKEDGVLGPMTLAAAREYVVKKCNSMGIQVPAKGIVWVRVDEKLTNTFDDFAVIFNKSVAQMVFGCSTTAGKYYIQNPLTVGGITGTAIAKKQVVTNSHIFVTSPNWKTLWLGAPYFQQILPIEIYRDGNKDENINTEVVTKGLYGINFHHAGLGNFIDNWSAGCFTAPKADWIRVCAYFSNNEKIDMILI